MASSTEPSLGNRFSLSETLGGKARAGSDLWSGSKTISGPCCGVCVPLYSWVHAERAVGVPTFKCSLSRWDARLVPGLGTSASGERGILEFALCCHGEFGMRDEGGV